MTTVVDEKYNTLRSLGNHRFVEGNFVEAEELYSKILAEFDNDRAVIFTNRSAARLSLGKTNEALDDAQKAIESDRRWIKAYYRKASALEQLKRYENCTMLLRLFEIYKKFKPRKPFDNELTACDSSFFLGPKKCLKRGWLQLMNAMQSHPHG